MLTLMDIGIDKVIGSPCQILLLGLRISFRSIKDRITINGGSE